MMSTGALFHSPPLNEHTAKTVFSFFNGNAPTNLRNKLRDI